MYQSSITFDDKIHDSARTFHALITVGNDSIPDVIKSVRFSGGSNGEDDFAIGSVVSQYVDVEISDTDIILENREFLLQIGLDIGSTTEYIPMGYFTASKPKRDERGITITANDRMMKMEVECDVSSLPESTNTLSVLQRVSALTGVPVNTQGLASINMNRPSGYTCREVLQIVAQLYGGFAICNRQGQIIITWYSDSSYTVSAGRYWDTFKHNDYAYVLDKLTCYIGKDEEGYNISVSAGTGQLGITFSNVFMTQDILNNVWTHIGEFTYMPGSIRFMGDPRIDPWDIITVSDLNGTSYKVPAMTLSHEYDGGLTTTVGAAGKTETEQSADFKGPMNSQMERYAVQLALIDTALVGKLSVREAELTYATIARLNLDIGTVNEAIIKKADITDLNVTNETVANLQATKAEVGDLNAAVGRFNILEGNFANLKTILAGNAAATAADFIQLNASNSIIDSALIKSIISQNVTVNDLLAGRISTDRFEIGSDDGGMVFTGNTAQWLDEDDNVRIQIGQDAQGNFSFLIANADGDPLFYENGLTADAIPSGLIVNDMVASNANVDASKINIDSLFRVMNGSQNVLKANRIYFDETGQTLVQQYTQISDNLTSLGSRVTTAENAADQAAQAARAATDALSGIDTLTNFIVDLTNDAHVVHTYSDGSGGIYTDVITQVTAWLGDVDVSAQCQILAYPSSSVAGVWDAGTRIYQVTGMTDVNGYVDFDVTYDIESRSLTDRSGNALTDRNGNPLFGRSGDTHMRKRFSISKSPDGRIGVSYNLVSSTNAISLAEKTGALTPAQIRFNANQNDNGTISSYAGIFVIYESTDYTNFTQKYRSSAAETSTLYTPTSIQVKSIRCELQDSNGSILDTESIPIIVSADGLTSDISGVSESVVEVATRVGSVETGIEGLRTNLSNLSTQIAGLSDGTLSHTWTFEIRDGIAYCEAHIYKGGSITDIRTEFDPTCFIWQRITEDGIVDLGTGYTKDVPASGMDLGGVVRNTFIAAEDFGLTDRYSNPLTDRNGNRYLVRVA